MSFKNSFPSPDFNGGFLNSGASAGSSARLPLSTCPDGQLFGIVPTSTTAIHTCTTYALDEVYLWAANYSDSNVELSIAVGTESVTNPAVVHPVAASDGFTLVWPGLPHKNLTLYVKSSAGTSLMMGGFVMRHNPLSADNLNAGYGAGGTGN